VVAACAACTRNDALDEDLEVSQLVGLALVGELKPLRPLIVDARVRDENNERYVLSDRGNVPDFLRYLVQVGELLAWRAREAQDADADVHINTIPHLLSLVARTQSHTD